MLSSGVCVCVCVPNCCPFFLSEKPWLNVVQSSFGCSGVRRGFREEERRDAKPEEFYAEVAHGAARFSRRRPCVSSCISSVPHGVGEAEQSTETVPMPPHSAMESKKGNASLASDRLMIFVHFLHARRGCVGKKAHKIDDTP